MPARFSEVCSSGAAPSSSEALSPRPLAQARDAIWSPENEPCPLCPLPALSHAAFEGSLIGINKAKEVSWLKKLVRSERHETESAPRCTERSSLFEVLMIEEAIKKAD